MYNKYMYYIVNVPCCSSHASWNNCNILWKCNRIKWNRHVSVRSTVPSICRVHHNLFNLCAE